MRPAARRRPIPYPVSSQYHFLGRPFLAITGISVVGFRYRHALLIFGKKYFYGCREPQGGSDYRMKAQIAGAKPRKETENDDADTIPIV